MIRSFTFYSAMISLLNIQSFKTDFDIEDLNMTARLWSL